MEKSKSELEAQETTATPTTKKVLGLTSVNHFNIGMKYYYGKEVTVDMQKAKEHFEKAIEADPNLVMALEKLGDIKQVLSHEEAALLQNKTKQKSSVTKGTN
jgi:Tfp pilus assembly protein PilF